MRNTLPFFVVFFAIAHGIATANPPKLAGLARMDVHAQDAVGALTHGAIIAGAGSIDRMIWLPATERPLTYVGLWQIRHFSWTEVGLRFVPQSNGVVTIDLLGPWEMSPSNVIYQQEVFWDALSAIGTSLTNGSFEILQAGIPTGWSNPWGGPVVVSSDPPAIDGSNHVAVWNERRLRIALMVTGGVPVEIRGWARALVPAGFEDNPRIFDTDTPAHQAARRFMRGVNFANVLEAPAGEDWGGGPLEAADFDAVRALGFDHVRLPVSWNFHTGPGPSYVISNAFFARVDAVVTGLLARGVNVLLNLHHFYEFHSAPAAYTNKLYAIWNQLAEHYSQFPEGLAFEILNEPHQQATTEFMNSVYAHLIPKIRQTNPDRTIFIGPGNWSSISEIARLRLPADDSNIVVTVHSYEPFLFTTQGAYWSGDQPLTTNVVYPGPPTEPIEPHPISAQDPSIVEWFDQFNSMPTAYNPCSSNAFVALFEYARDWSSYYGRPVHVGEFGAIRFADPESRLRHYREKREALDRLGLGWAVWDWKAYFYIWDRVANTLAPGMHDALFPAPRIVWIDADRRVAGEAAVGKRIALQSASSLHAPWIAVTQQLLATPHVEFDSGASAETAFFRLTWEYP